MLLPPFLEVLGFQKAPCQAQEDDALGLRSECVCGGVRGVGGVSHCGFDLHLLSD